MPLSCDVVSYFKPANFIISSKLDFDLLYNDISSSGSPLTIALMPCGIVLSLSLILNGFAPIEPNIKSWMQYYLKIHNPITPEEIAIVEENTIK